HHQPSASMLILMLLTFRASVAFADHYYATSAGNPNNFTPLEMERAYESVAAIGDPSTDYKGVTQASLAAGLAVGHGAHVTEIIQSGLPANDGAVLPLVEATAGTVFFTLIYVRSCQSITAAGTYVLATDLSS